VVILLLLKIIIYKCLLLIQQDNAAVECSVQSPDSSLSDDLSVVERTFLSHIKDTMVKITSFSSGPMLTLKYVACKLDSHLLMANKIISEIPSETLTETNILAYAIAYLITSKICSPTYSENLSVSSPTWRV